MRFLVDVNLSPRIAEWLRAEGHDAVHLFEHGLERLADGEVFGKAIDGAYSLGSAKPSASAARPVVGRVGRDVLG